MFKEKINNVIYNNTIWMVIYIYLKGGLNKEGPSKCVS
jgi:hypothetical protein